MGDKRNYLKYVRENKIRIPVEKQYRHLERPELGDSEGGGGGGAQRASGVVTIRENTKRRKVGERYRLCTTGLRGGGKQQVTYQKRKPRRASRWVRDLGSSLDGRIPGNLDREKEKIR